MYPTGKLKPEAAHVHKTVLLSIICEQGLLQ